MTQILSVHESFQSNYIIRHNYHDHKTARRNIWNKLQDQTVNRRNYLHLFWYELTGKLTDFVIPSSVASIDFSTKNKSEEQ